MVQGPAAAASTTIFNSSHCYTTDITLSNSNLTATKSAGNGTSDACFANNFHASGRIVAEFSWASTAPGSGVDAVAFSVSTSGNIHSYFPGSSASDVAFTSAGNININNTTILGSGATWNSNTNVKICIAIDLTNQKFYAMIVGSGWVNSADPDTNTNGLSTATMTSGSITGMAGLYQSTATADKVTLVPSASDCTNVTTFTPL